MTICLLTAASSYAYAWSAKGHASIAVAAFDYLDDAHKASYAEVLLAFMPARTKDAASLLDNNASKKIVADMAIWPDKVRDKKIKSLFKSKRTNVPMPLESYSNASTANWHYVNAYFWDAPTQRILDPSIVESSVVDSYVVNQPKTKSACKPRVSGELHNIWPELLEAFKVSENPRQQAVILSFILHLAADAYQPLHVFSSLNQECQHDRGGNLYCVEPPIGFIKNGAKNCELNLHRLWDNGFGVFDSPLNQASNEFNSALYPFNYFQGNLSLLLGVYPDRAQLANEDSYKNASAELTHALAQNSVVFLNQTLRDLAKHLPEPPRKNNDK